MKKALSTLLLAASAALVGAQELPGYLPKTPEAASIDKFVDIPPGSYTGVAGYSVPLYTIEVEGYSIPITLNYHGMGIKVSEVSSSVGLGWSLSVGGISLSQNVIGEQDEFTTRLDVSSLSFDPQFGGANYDDAYVMTRINETSGNMALELQPDYYSYSLLHNSGKFIFDSQGVAHTIPKDDAMIQSPVLLRDNHGIEYRFGQMYNNVSIVITQGPSPSFISKLPAYNLEKIVFPSGREIDLSYVGGTLDYLANYTETESRLQGGPSQLCTALDTNISVPRYVIEEDVLSKITFDNGEVNFTYDSQPREDIGGKRLIGAEVKNSDGQVIRDYTFTNSYMVSPQDTGIYLSPSDPLYPGISKRLVLDEVKENISDRTYSFDYYDDYSFPNRFSKQVDFWGSYNGKVNTTYIHQYTYTDDSGNLKVRDGADRSPDLDFARTASLKTVHLPTGGKQEFAYELDDYKFDATENQFYKREHTAAVTSGSFGGSYAVVQLSSIAGPDYRDGFDYRLEFYWEGNPLDEDDLGDLPTGSYCYVDLLDQNDNLVQRLYHNIEVGLPDLSPGNTYKLRFARNSSALPGQAALWAKLTWYQNNTVYVANKQTGNLRIKSISLKDWDNQYSLKRNYTYRDPASPAFSSGAYNDFPEFHMSEYPADVDLGLICKYRNFSNNINAGTTTFRGKPVVYGHVTEEYVDYGDSSRNYYVQSQFSVPPADVIDYSEIPSSPHVHRGYYGGLLLSQKRLDNASAVVSETINQYTFDNHFVDDSADTDQGIPSDGLSLGIAIQLESISFLHSAIPPFSEPARKYSYNWTDYYYPTTWIKLTETRTIDHFDGYQVERAETFGYSEQNGHIRPTSITTTSSEQVETRVLHEYPNDLLAWPHSFDLVQGNRIGSPIATSTEERAPDNSWSALGRTETLYEDWGGGIVEPERVRTNKDGGLIGDRVVYHSYDSYGNPQEVSLKDGPRTVYIWGYDGTLPVAKIENATYSQVQGYAANIRSKSDQDDDRCLDSGSCDEKDLRTALASLRAALSGAMVTGYTYDPLLGVTSMTDPKGQTTHYRYDASGRLERVLDAQGLVVTEHTYNITDQ